MPTTQELAARLLRYATTYDKRPRYTNPQALADAIVAWSRALEDGITLDMGMNAIEHHYRCTSEPINPSVININTRHLREKAHPKAPAPEPEPHTSPERIQEIMAEYAPGLASRLKAKD